jgi:hypothetical protein
VETESLHLNTGDQLECRYCFETLKEPLKPTPIHALTVTTKHRVVWIVELKREKQLLLLAQLLMDIYKRELSCRWNSSWDGALPSAHYSFWFRSNSAR